MQIRAAREAVKRFCWIGANPPNIWNEAINDDGEMNRQYKGQLVFNHLIKNRIK